MTVRLLLLSQLSRATGLNPILGPPTACEYRMPDWISLKKGNTEEGYEAIEDDIVVKLFYAVVVETLKEYKGWEVHQWQLNLLLMSYSFFLTWCGSSITNFLFILDSGHGPLAVQWCRWTFGVEASVEVLCVYDDSMIKNLIAFDTMKEGVYGVWWGVSAAPPYLAATLSFLLLLLLLAHALLIILLSSAAVKTYFRSLLQAQQSAPYINFMTTWLGTHGSLDIMLVQGWRQLS